MEWPHFVPQQINQSSCIITFISEVLLRKSRFQKYHLYKLQEQNQNKLLGKITACFLLKVPKENEAHMNNFNFRSN